MSILKRDIYIGICIFNRDICILNADFSLCTQYLSFDYRYLFVNRYIFSEISIFTLKISVYYDTSYQNTDKYILIIQISLLRILIYLFPNVGMYISFACHCLH